MIDLNDVLPFRIEVKDEDGVLADSSDGVLTVTYPDGTDAVVPLSHVSTGLYEPDAVADQYGRHTWVYDSTSPQTRSAGVFDVVDASAGLVSLQDARDYLNKQGVTGTSNDEELRFHLLTASKILNSMVGSSARTTRTQKIRRPTGGLIGLDHMPVLSVTSVTPYAGTAYTVGNLDIDLAAGLIYPAYGQCFTGYPITVEYVTGRRVVPETIQMAVLDLIRINWRPQQGGGHSAYDVEEAGTIRLGFFVPKSMEAMLKDDLLPPVVA